MKVVIGIKAPTHLRLAMHRLLGGKGTAPPGTPMVARHGAALATMTLNMKQTEDPSSVSEILERSHQAQAEAVQYMTDWHS